MSNQKTDTKVSLPETWEEVCKHIGRDPKRLPNVDDVEEEYGLFVISNFKLMVATRVLNNIRDPKWKANYANKSQWKHFPVFLWDDVAGAFRFWDSFCDDSYATSASGAPFALLDEPTSDHLGKYFIEDWNNVLRYYEDLVKK